MVNTQNSTSKGDRIAISMNVAVALSTQRREILIELPFLDPTIFYADDSPRYGEGVPKFVTWKDAENALNAPWNHIITA